MNHADAHRKLLDFAGALVDQQAARVAIAPQKPAGGFWFGGGNVVRGADGALYLVGRYRNHGDSRTGLSAGERGLELAIFRADGPDGPFEKIVSWSKSDLSPPDRPVLSIEGSALRITPDGVELFVSSEKDNVGYPSGLEGYLKPGAGVWSIDRLAAESIEALADAAVEPCLSCDDPRWLHVKDPHVLDRDGETVLGFCTHPFNWSSSNSAVAVRPAGADAFDPPDFTFFPRGFTWDVAISRITCLLPVPRVGTFADGPGRVLAFYDGGECLRNLDEHKAAVKRPRGCSCEELGGLAVAPRDDLRAIERLSVCFPAFVSPHGTGCSRYVSVLAIEDAWIAAWQQSRPDRSQPLVMNVLARKDAEAILA